VKPVALLPAGRDDVAVPWTAPEVNRQHSPPVAGERVSLQGWLDYHRQTLLWKCSGLSGDQLAIRPLGSSLSLLGLVRHLTYVQRVWLRARVAGMSDLEVLYCTDEFPDGDIDLADGADAEADFARYLAECIAADEAVQGRSLDDTFVHSRLGVAFDLRWVYTHLIEEFARHNGHADLLREHIDGATGE
jgi:hypothetical protein